MKKKFIFIYFLFKYSEITTHLELIRFYNKKSMIKPLTCSVVDKAGGNELHKAWAKRALQMTQSDDAAQHRTQSSPLRA